jgi:hypothetical protein
MRRRGVVSLEIRERERLKFNPPPDRKKVSRKQLELSQE